MEQNVDAAEQDVIRRNQYESKMKNIENFADHLISTSADDICCEDHEQRLGDDHLICEKCESLKEMVNKYQNHKHTFTCAKKNKTMTLKEHEGHGKLSGFIKGPELTNIPVCRFRFPRFPMDETKLILGISKDEDEQGNPAVLIEVIL